MRRVKHYLNNFFIPHEGNNHLPHSVRHKSLWYYSGTLVALKVLTLVLLFAAFPTIAEFSTITQVRITELVNQARQQNNLSSVTINPTLQKAAELKLQDMINNSYFAHTSPNGITPWQWFKESGYLYTYAGENLAMNFTEAEEAHRAWMDSSTHRANILNPNYQEIGVAVGLGKIDGQSATLVVELFGTSFAPPVLAKAPSSSAVQGEKVAVIQEPSESTSGQVTQPIFPEPTKTIKPIEDIGQLEPQNQTPDKLGYGSGQAEKLTEITGGSQEVTIESPEPLDILETILRFIQKFYWVILGFIILALLLKIVIRANIQHKRVIVHGIMVIGVGLLLLVLHLHFLENISGPVIIY